MLTSPLSPFVCFLEGRAVFYLPLALHRVCASQIFTGWVNERMDGWMDGWKNREVEGRTDRQVDGWMGRRMDGLVAGNKNR